jgi:hypothetical protein
VAVIRVLTFVLSPEFQLMKDKDQHLHVSRESMSKVFLRVNTIKMQPLHTNSLAAPIIKRRHLKLFVIIR